MRRTRRSASVLVAFVVALVSVAPRAAQAHDVRGEVVFLDVGERVVHVELQVPIRQFILADPEGEVSEDLSNLRPYFDRYFGARDRAGRAFGVRIQRAAVEQMDDGDVIVIEADLTAPAESDARWFELRDELVVHRVVTHTIYVFLRRDLRVGAFGEHRPLLGTMHYQQRTLVVDRTAGSLRSAFLAVFSLGMRHIGEGTDHLLFLLMLLLPAPLLARGRRWDGQGTLKKGARETIKIVTAFTVGHSLTLAFAAFRGGGLGSRPVEILIALSILVSAVHAMRPLFPGKEAFVAGAFGLVHGLAFASALQGFGFDRTTLVVSVLGFNLGVEAMQLAVVAVTMPLLAVLSRSRDYTMVRLGGAAFGAIAATAWAVERAFAVRTPVTSLVEFVAHHAVWVLGALATLTLWELSQPRAAPPPADTI